jgi:hypothetical protein
MKIKTHAFISFPPLNKIELLTFRKNKINKNYAQFYFFRNHLKIYSTIILKSVKQIYPFYKCM